LGARGHRRWGAVPADVLEDPKPALDAD